MRTLVVFEDPAARAFAILTCTRAVFDLRCGAQTLLERLCNRIEHDRLVLFPRPELLALCAETHPNATVSWTVDAAADGEFVFVNGRLLVMGDDLAFLHNLAATLRADGPGGAFVEDDDLLVAVCDAPTASRLATELHNPAANRSSAQTTRDILGESVDATTGLTDGAPERSVLLEHVWDLVQLNGYALADDFARGPGPGVSMGARIDPGVHLMNDSNMRIEEGVRLRPGVVLDAEEGPVWLAAGVDVQPNVVVRGPAWIGPDCLVKAGSKIHENTSVGPVCKIGGEIEGSILQGYSNKQHEGFLGHAYLGEWVNLGADTNNSDLKNNYGPVRMWESGAFVDTRSLFMGLVAADHVKSAINTQFNTGTVVGFSSQIFGTGFPPKYVPPFSWGGAGETYDVERALATARTVMARRQIELSTAYESVFRRIHEEAHA